MTVNLPLPRKLKDCALFALQWLYAFLARGIDAQLSTGPALVIAPHPDDETLGCGAAIIRMRAMGQKVRVVIVTDGAASGNSTVIAPPELARMRQKETFDAGKILGLSPDDIAFLNFPDAGIAQMVGDIASALRSHIVAMRPALVFSPYGWDRHADHRAIAAAVEQLIRDGTLAGPVYEYPISFWPYAALRHLLRPAQILRLRRIDAREHLPVKMLAMQAHRSQIENLTREKSWFYFKPYQLARFFRAHEIFFEKPRA